MSGFKSYIFGGNDSSGGGVVISGTPYYHAMFNALGDNVEDSSLFETEVGGVNYFTFESPDTVTVAIIAISNVPEENSINFNMGSQLLQVQNNLDLAICYLGENNHNVKLFSDGVNDHAGLEIYWEDGLGATSNAIIKNDDGLKIDGGSGVFLKWPLADGSAGQVMKTDGAGVLGFTTPTVLTPLIYNSVPVSSFFSNCGSGNVDLYTVPSDKKLLVSYQLNFYNNTAGPLDIYLAIKVSGTYYKISNTSTIAANTSAGAQLPSVIVLNAGETIAVVTTGAGINVALQLHEFSDTEKIKTERILSLANGDNTLYTVPANKKAIILSTTNYITGNPGTISVSNYSGGTRTLKFYSVKSGNAISDSYKIAGNTSISNNATGSGNVNQSLTEGDFLALNTNAASNQIAWVTLFEI
jgi:hypothetical protein